MPEGIESGEFSYAYAGIDLPVERSTARLMNSPHNVPLAPDLAVFKSAQSAFAEGRENAFPCSRASRFPSDH